MLIKKKTLEKRIYYRLANKINKSIVKSIVENAKQERIEYLEVGKNLEVRNKTFVLSRTIRVLPTCESIILKFDL